MVSRNRHSGENEYRSAAYARLFAGTAIVLMFWGAIVFPPDFSGSAETAPAAAAPQSPDAPVVEPPSNDFGARS